MRKGQAHTEETKAKIRQAALQQKTKVRKHRIGFTKNKGRVFSEEHKANLSKAGKGRVFSEEHKAKIGKAIQKTNRAKAFVSIANNSKI